VTESKPVLQGKIGVVTVTYNSNRVLKEFFNSFAAQSYKDTVLYLVDNASQDKTLEMARQRTDLSIVILPNLDNLGVAEGNNQGIRAALADGCECVLLLNNDTVFPDDLIAQLYNGLDRYDCDMTTGKMYFHDKPDMLWCAGGNFPLWPAFMPTHDGYRKIDTGQYDQPRRITYTPTCCLLVRRTVFERVGTMDEAYFFNWDDTDFLLRSMHHGITLWYVPEAKLWHKVASLTSRHPDNSARLGVRNRVYFTRKHLPVWQAYLSYWIDQSRYAASVLLFKSTLARWRLRRTAAREGWDMIRR
jgi:GT2 family glycosyltransferase